MINKKCVFWVISGMVLFSWHGFAEKSKTLLANQVEQVNEKPEIEMSATTEKGIIKFIKEYLIMEKTNVFAMLKQYQTTMRKKYVLEGDLTKHYQDLDNDNLSPKQTMDMLYWIGLLKMELSPTRKIEDPEFLRLVLAAYTKGDQYFARSALDCIPGFPNTLIEEHIDTLMAPFLVNEDVFGERGLLMIPLSNKTKEKYKTFLEKQIKKEKAAYAKNENTERYKSGPMFFKLDMLHYCGRLGDQSSIQELINIYKNIKWTDPWDKDARQTMTSLLDIGTRDCLVAVLERFHENIGAPDYYVGTSPRYDILQALWRKHPNDPFFAKYYHYLGANNSDWILDDSVGGEAGVRELYKGLIKWAKDNLQYDLNLDDADPKIKANIVDKYNLPTE